MASGATWQPDEDGSFIEMEDRQSKRAKEASQAVNPERRHSPQAASEKSLLRVQALGAMAMKPVANWIPVKPLSLGHHRGDVGQLGAR